MSYYIVLCYTILFSSFSFKKHYIETMEKIIWEIVSNETISNMYLLCDLQIYIVNMH